jgi:hypothetical protein
MQFLKNLHPIVDFRGSPPLLMGQLSSFVARKRNLAVVSIVLLVDNGYSRLLITYFVLISCDSSLTVVERFRAAARAFALPDDCP